MKNNNLSVIVEIVANEDIKPFLGNFAEALGGERCELFLVGDSGDIGESMQQWDSSFSNIIYIPDEPNRQAAVNNALNSAHGDIVHLTRSSCVYDKGSVLSVLEAFRKNDEQIISLEPRFYDVKGKQTRIVPFKLERELKTYIIDLKKTPECWCPALFSLFIDRSLIEDNWFSEDLRYEYHRAFIAEVFSRCSSYRMILNKVITNEFVDRDYYNYNPMYNRDWYFEELLAIAEVLLRERDELRIRQRVLADFIKLQFAANQDGRDKTILEGSDLDEYISSVRNILIQIDDDIICDLSEDTFLKRLPNMMNKVLLYIKYDTNSLDIHPVLTAKDVQEDDEFSCDQYDFVTEKGVAIASSKYFSVNFKAINYKNDVYTFEGLVKNTYFDSPDQFKITVIGADGSTIETRRTQVFSLWKYFGKTVDREMTISFDIPVQNLKKGEYKLLLEYKGVEFKIKWRFVKSQARIRQVHKHNFWVTDGRLLRYDFSNRLLVIQKTNALKNMAHEVMFWKDILERMRRNRRRGLSFILLRCLYYITKPVYGRKNIWLTFDQLFKGGDNGEYFYRYVNDLNNKNQILYYAVNKDTKEYRELSKKYKTVLEYNSLKHKLISLHTKIVFATRADVSLYAGFAHSAEVYFRNLMNFDVVCLQHGLSIQQIAQYQNRLYDNFKYYFCVSKYEIANLSKPIYGFEDTSILALTGAPRYDGLVGKPKKQIIISPTWRRNVTSGTNQKGSNHEYSINFKNTEYFKIYNKLINDEKLIECAKKTGYKLIYLIHPILSPQINDFDANDYLEIIPGSEVNYEKILVESAIMLTDHSGIMYDFAYQRKPLVYYHPDELPPQYAAGGLDYETMGFGPVCKTHDTVVNELCKLMENDGVIDPVYKERIEDFFEFDDQRNCERVYNAAKEFEKSRTK